MNAYNTGNTCDLQCALSQVSFDKTFISHHLEKYDSNTPKKMIVAMNVKFIVKYY